MTISPWTVSPAEQVAECEDPGCDCHWTMYNGLGEAVTRYQNPTFVHEPLTEEYVTWRVRNLVKGLSVMAAMRVLHAVIVEVVRGFDD